LTFRYRAFFHPLNDFPGPFGAKLSKLWAMGKVVQSNIKWYKVLEKLHVEYGDFVRVGMRISRTWKLAKPANTPQGPREIMIFDSEAIVPLLSFGSAARKGPFYDSIGKSLHATRNHDVHRSRRKVWDFAFKKSKTKL
jgi:hypothetical protein